MLFFFQLSDTRDKIESTSQQVASKLNRDCQCMLSAAYITAAQLSCDPKATTHVIYRARLSSTPDTSSTDLVRLLQEWVTSGRASVTLEFVQLTLEPSCIVRIESLSDPICPAPTTTSEVPGTSTVVAVESTSNLTVYIIATLAVVAFAMILIVVVICAFMIYQRRFSGRYNTRSVLVIH